MTIELKVAPGEIVEWRKPLNVGDVILFTNDWTDWLETLLSEKTIASVSVSADSGLSVSAAVFLSGKKVNLSVTATGDATGPLDMQVQVTTDGNLKRSCGIRFRVVNLVN